MPFGDRCDYFVSIAESEAHMGVQWTVLNLSHNTLSTLDISKFFPLFRKTTKQSMNELMFLFSGILTIWFRFHSYLNRNIQIINKVYPSFMDYTILIPFYIIIDLWYISHWTLVILILSGLTPSFNNLTCSSLHSFFVRNVFTTCHPVVDSSSILYNGICILFDYHCTNYTTFIIIRQL